MRNPDLTGPERNRRAWRCAMAPVGQREVPDLDATIGTWLVHAPGAHPFWSYWWISLVHLRPIAGVKPAMITRPGAGWEMICFAQDPSVSPDPDDIRRTVRYLRPIDWIVQFGDVKGDVDAERVALAVVYAIMRGASPDSDWRRFWTNSIPATAKCLAEGGHPTS